MRNDKSATGIRRSASGFTLVEVLVAITITMFLLGGMLTLLQNTRKAATSQTSTSTQQDNARLALKIMTDTIQLAGYFPNVSWTGTLASPSNTAALGEFGIWSDPPAQAFFTAPSASSPQIVAGIGDWGTPNDSIAVRYETTSGDGTLGCTGATNTSGVNEFFVNTFYIDPVTGDFSCMLTTLTAAGASYNVVSRDPAIIVPAGNTTAVGMAPTGVKSLEFLYGVKTNVATPGNSADSYLMVSQMSPTNWLNVVSVMVRVTFVNPVVTTPAQQDLQFWRVISLMGQTGVTL